MPSQTSPVKPKPPQGLESVLSQIPLLPDGERWVWYWELHKSDRLALIDFYDSLQPIGKEIR